MTRLRVWTTLLVLLLWPAAARPEKPLLWAADEEGGAPFIFPDADNPGKYKGFEVDLAALLAKELGRPIEWTHYDFKSLFDGLRRKDFDFAMNGLEVLPERRKIVRFSRPYYVYRLQLAVRRDDPRFGSLQDMVGRDDVEVGTLEGTAAAQTLDELGIKKRGYDGQTELYKELENKRLDGVYIDTIIQNQYLPSFKSLRLVGPTERQNYYALALRKEDEKLAQEIDKALDRLLASGELERIYRKWKIWNDDQQGLYNFRGYDKEVTAQPSPREENSEKSPDEWSFLKYFPLLLDGAIITVKLTVLSMALAVVLGLPIAVARLYGPPPLRGAALVYVEFFRGTPVLLLLYFLYYVLPDFGLKWDAFYVAVVGFGINYAAYEAEIYRAGIGGVPAGQWEAATSLGMSRPLTFRRIILPQAIRAILPPMTNDFVALFKDTSVVSIIAVVELTKQYQTLSKTSFKYVEIGLVTAALYLVMSVPLGYLSRYLEKRWSQEA